MFPGATQEDYLIFVCEPSQKGGFFVRLQPQKNTCLVSSAINATGVKGVPLCAPSQNGCFLLKPQEHK